MTLPDSLPGATIVEARLGTWRLMLAGTIHLDIDPPGSFVDALGSVRTLLVEVDPFRDLGGRDATWRLDQPRLMSLLWACMSVGLPMTMLGVPEVVAAFSVRWLRTCKGLPMDSLLCLEAEAFGCRLEGLETFDEVMIDIALIDQEDVNRIVDAAVDFAASPPAVWSQAKCDIIAAWTSGRLPSMRKYPSVPPVLLAQRNLRWLPKIVAAAADGAMVAVGAAHMRGPDGLYALLHAEGFELSVVA
jgi:hypothetical protein